MAQGSTSAIYTAAGANLAIAVAKFVAGGLTGSAAMFAEGVHSVVDTANQGLLLIGLKKATKPADSRHPFGYGRELYFYAFIVALFIFLGGGLFAIYEGWHKVEHPEPIADAQFFGWSISGFWINVSVLLFAILAEGYSCYVALKAFWLEKGKVGAVTAIRNSKDPALFTIVIEDLAAQIGLLIALTGVILAERLDMPVLDGAASIGIGLVLIGMAGFLMIETHGLLIGEAADPKLIDCIHHAITLERGVSHVTQVLTQHMGPADILVTTSLDFDDTLTAGEIEAAVTRIEEHVKRAYPQVTRMFVEARAAPRRTPAAAAAAQ